MFQDASREALIKELKTSREELWRQAARLPPSIMRARPADDEWSIIEVLAHLIDVDEHWMGQALAIRNNPEHIFVHFDDERWKREHRDIREARGYRT